MNLPLVLASSSPYRKQLLTKICSDFACFSPDIDESSHKNETAAQLVLRLAEQKALAVKAHHADHVIIASDQVCVNQDSILGKPGCHDNAVEQLRQASGKCITFYTGLAVLNSQTNHMISLVETFTVHFKQLDEAVIQRYLLLEKPYNCAGSFMSEGAGICLFERLEGKDPNTLVGLPLISLCEILSQQGFKLPY